MVGEGRRGQARGVGERGGGKSGTRAYVGTGDDLDLGRGITGAMIRIRSQLRTCESAKVMSQDPRSVLLATAPLIYRAWLCYNAALFHMTWSNDGGILEWRC